MDIPYFGVYNENMNKEKLKDAISSLEEENPISFYVMGEKASNRFDHAKSVPLDSLRDEDIVGYHLYALIADAVFYKSKEKDESRKGLKILDGFLKCLVENTDGKLREETEQDFVTASMVLTEFILSEKRVEVSTLLSCLFPFAVLDYSMKDSGLDQKTYADLNKNRKRILNMSLLAIRSLFRSLLTMISVKDGSDIRIDTEDPLNGLFVYQGSLFVPTMRNAFSLRDFKTVVNDGIDRASSSFSLDDVSSVSVLYLVKDTIANYRF